MDETDKKQPIIIGFLMAIGFALIFGIRAAVGPIVDSSTGLLNDGSIPLDNLSWMWMPAILSASLSFYLGWKLFEKK